MYICVGEQYLWYSTYQQKWRQRVANVLLMYSTYQENGVNHVASVHATVYVYREQSMQIGNSICGIVLTSKNAINHVGVCQLAPQATVQDQGVHLYQGRVELPKAKITRSKVMQLPKAKITQSKVMQRFYFIWHQQVRDAMSYLKQRKPKSKVM